MSSISSGTTSTTTLVHSGDTTGSLVFKTNDTGSGGTTAMTIDTSQKATLNNDATISGLTIGKGGGSVSTNTAVGASALAGNTTGANNVALGYQAGNAVTTGANNTFLGTQVGKNATTGAGNVIIGALNSSGTYAPLYDVTTTNDRLALGTTSTTNAYVQVSWTVLSDARDKTNIVNLDKGLSFINSLRPVEYQFKKSREDETPHGNLRYGFLAQEVLELEGDNPVIIDNEDSEKLRYNGESLVPVLVKAIQELKAIVDTQAQTITALTARIVALENKP